MEPRNLLQTDVEFAENPSKRGITVETKGGETYIVCTERDRT